MPSLFTMSFHHSSLATLYEINSASDLTRIAEVGAATRVISPHLVHSCMNTTLNTPYFVWFWKLSRARPG